MEPRGFAAIAAWFRRLKVRRVTAPTVEAHSVEPPQKRFDFTSPKMDYESLPPEAYMGMPEPEIYGDWSLDDVFDEDVNDDGDIVTDLTGENTRHLYRTSADGFGWFNLSDLVRDLFWGDTPELACRICGSEMVMTDAEFLVCSGDDNPGFESCDGDAYDGS